MINLAPGFWPIFGPLGPTGGPREPRERPRLEKWCRLHQKSTPETNSKSHSRALCACGTNRKKAPQGLPRSAFKEKMMNLVAVFWPNFGPLGPTAGPGSPGNGPGSNNSAGCAKIQPRRPIPSPFRGHFVFWGPTAKI